MAKKVTHGGKRKGAGRKADNPEGKTKVIGATIPEKLVKELDRYAKAQGWNRSRAITEAIRKLLGKSAKSGK